MSPLDHRIITILWGAIGRDALISSRQIALRVGLRGAHGDRVVRERISEMLSDGTLEDQELPLVAIPGRGYFVPTDIEEAEAYHDLLRTLAAEAARKADAARRLFASVGLHLHSKSR